MVGFIWSLEVMQIYEKIDLNLKRNTRARKTTVFAMGKMTRCIILLIVTILLSGCSSVAMLINQETESDINENNSHSFLSFITDFQHNPNYLIASEIFEESNIRISFPQVEMVDTEKQEQINNLLWWRIYNYFNWVSEMDEPVFIDIDYEIKVSSSRLLSVVYRGVVIVGGAGITEVVSRPRWIFRTSNINIETGEEIRLSDVLNIDERLIELLQSDYVVFPNHEDAINMYHEQKYFVREVIARDYFLQWWIENVDNIEFYFTEDSLGISIDGLGGAAGDHVEIEISYETILNMLK